MEFPDKDRKDPATMPQPPLVVSVLYDRLWTFEYAMTTLFGLEWPELGIEPYRFASAAAEKGPLRTSCGLKIQADGGLEILDEADLVVMPGWRDVTEVPNRKLLGAIRGAAERGARIASLWDGVFVLAHAGVLDGKRATTHWHLTERFARQFPSVTVVRDVLYAQDGRIFTSAGCLAGIDMLLAIVRQDYGAKVANRFASRMIASPHRHGDQPQIVGETLVPASASAIAASMQWMESQLAKPITLATLARRAAMSERTFARRFRAATGTSPMQWLARRRISLAQELLETTDQSIEQIALAAGFGTPEVLRHHFRRSVGVSPTVWRRSFTLLRTRQINASSR